MEKVNYNNIESNNNNDEIFAHIKHLKISPIKLRRVANAVRGKSLEDVLAVLKWAPHKSARFLYKAVFSAASNAINNQDLSRDKLFVSTLNINEGPRFKRFRARARGRMFAIEKKSSHIIVGVKESR